MSARNWINGSWRSAKYSTSLSRIWQDPYDFPLPPNIPLEDASPGTLSDLTYVGGTVTGIPDADAMQTLDLTHLTGGIDNRPILGDLIFIVVGWKGSADHDFTAPPGFTELADILQATGQAANFGLFYQRVTTNVREADFLVRLPNATRISIAAHVWRFADPTTPLDVTTTTAVGTNGPPNAPSITTATNNAVVLAFGVSTDFNSISAVTVPSGMENFVNITNINESNNRNTTSIASVVVPTAGAYNPAAFGGGVGNSAWVAATVAIRPANVVATITGTASNTQAAHTVSAAGTVLVRGTSSLTQAGNTPSAAGDVFVTGTASPTQADNTVSATGLSSAIEGSASLTQDDNTGSAAGTVLVSGTSSLTQADDTVSAAGSVFSGTGGSANVTQDDNTVSAVGVVRIVGTASNDEAPDTTTAVGVVRIVGTSSLTQADNTVSAAGGVRTVGTANLTQADNTGSAAGVVRVVGTLSQTQADHTASSSGVVGSGGFLNVTQDANTTSAAGVVRIVGTASLTEAPDTTTTVGVVRIVGTAALTQVDHTATTVGRVRVAGTSALTQDAHTVSSAGVVLVRGTAALTQASQTVTAVGTVLVRGTSSLTQAANTGSAAGKVLVRGTSALTQDDNTGSADGTVIRAEAPCVLRAGVVVHGLGAGVALPQAAGIIRATVAYENLVIAVTYPQVVFATDLGIGLEPELSLRAAVSYLRPTSEVSYSRLVAATCWDREAA